MGFKGAGGCDRLLFVIILLFHWSAVSLVLDDSEDQPTGAKSGDPFPKDGQGSPLESVHMDGKVGNRERSARISFEGHQLLNVTQLNDTTMVGKLRTTVIEWMKKPYVHGIVFPAVVGIACAFVVVISIVGIRGCVKAQARRRRRRRIRNLADELKTDKTMLLGDSSDEEF